LIAGLLRLNPARFFLVSSTGGISGTRPEMNSSTLFLKILFRTPKKIGTSTSRTKTRFCLLNRATNGKSFGKLIFIFFCYFELKQKNTAQLAIVKYGVMNLLFELEELSRANFSGRVFGFLKAHPFLSSCAQFEFNALNLNSRD
jgi:hypothetical protein